MCMVLGLGLNGRRSGGGGAPAVTFPANFSALNADGWSATYAAPPTFDPVASPEYVTVTRPGYDASGNAATLSENLVVMKRRRQAYPSQASLTTDQVVLSDYIYATDTVLGAVNNSTRVAPKPIAMWLNRDLERCTGNTYTARLAVAHAHARNGKPVAAVKFRATDGTTTVETLVSGMSNITYAASGYTVPHFEGALDFSALTQGAAITVDAIIYPWVGVPFQISLDADTYPSPNLTTLKVLNDRTGAYGTAYAYVDPVAGNDGTAAANANPVTAAASPYLTLSAAATAIRAYNNANFGRNFTDGGVIRLVEGATVLSASIRTVGVSSVWPLTIEAANPALKATTILRSHTATTANSVPNQMVFKNITIQRGATGSLTFLDNAATALSFVNLMAFENCGFDANGHGTYAATVYKTGLCYFIDCTQVSSIGQGAVSSVVNKTTKVIGCRGNFTQGAPNYGVLGSHISADSAVGQPPATAAVPIGAGCLFGWSHFWQVNVAQRCLSSAGVVNARGLAAVASVFEHSSGDTAPAFWISADGELSAHQNVVVQCCTVVGSRTNWLYQDTGTTTIAKSGYMAFSAHDNRNCKTDVFGANANLVGNWGPAHNVGVHHNALRQGSADGFLASYGVNNWKGELQPIGEVSGSSGTPLDFDWLDDQSFTGSGGGNGDYTPGPATVLPFIPAGLAPYPVDMKGRTINNTGSARIGALQAA